ncbi:MAG: hypothetical protein M3389_05745, partial [Actinomycetota bacterium]|nr:hypothetical protein [Actinomycetota bacterium]
ALQLASLVNDGLVRHNPRLRVLGVLVTQVDRRWTLAGDTRRRLQDAGIHRLRVEIPFRVRVGAAPRDGAPTAATQPDGAVGAAYDRLAADLIATVLR